MRPDLGKMLNEVGSIAASGKVYKSPATKLNIALIVEGVPSEESAREAVESAISSIYPKSGKLLNAEMKQFVEYFLGYPFFKDEEEFKDEHFKFIDNSQSSPISSDHLEHILKTASWATFKKDTALWRFTMYTNYLPTRSEFYFYKDKKYSLRIRSGSQLSRWI
jgi:hypothetical protein